MTNIVDKPHPESPKKFGRGNRRTAVIIGLACVGVVAAIVALNSDALAVGPGASASNSAPVILSVTPSTERLEPLDHCRLVCDAADGDGDALTYTWTTSQGTITGQGASVDWAAPDAEGLFRVSVTAEDGKGTVAESSISLRVQYNNSPQFQSVSSFTEGVRPGASVPIACSAVDIDGDDITYSWHATYGEIQGDGDSIVWTAPDTFGSYVVSVTARDALGAETQREILINVTPSPTPKLGTFLVTGVLNDMLKYDAGVWETYLGRSCRIECVVVEGDEPYTYAWSVDNGTLTADGAVATWTAPDKAGPAKITVDVTDALGNTNSGQLLMYVEDCTCKFK